jgi:predicted nuclease with TOPRIM domain
MRDIKTLLLALLSTGLVATWVYHLYDKTIYSNQKREVYIKDSIAVAEAVRDSLQKIYSSTINELDDRLDSTKTNADSLKFQLGDRLNEIFKLKNEINDILKNKGATKADMQLAQSKILELQEMVKNLQTEKQSMEEEKKRLNDIMVQLSGDVLNLQQSMKKLDEENKVLADKVQLASVFVASEIKLTPVTIKNEKEQETTAAKKASKLVISFAVQNNINQYTNADMYVIITQPDGRIIKNDDVWESAFMETYNDQKINYTRKVRFEYQKGEVKRILFSLNPDTFQKGNYTLQLYHKGYMIGQTTKALN